MILRFCNDTIARTQATVPYVTFLAAGKVEGVGGVHDKAGHGERTLLVKGLKLGGPARI